MLTSSGRRARCCAATEDGAALEQPGVRPSAVLTRSQNWGSIELLHCIWVCVTSGAAQAPSNPSRCRDPRAQRKDLISLRPTVIMRTSRTSGGPTFGTPTWRVTGVYGQ